MAEQLLLYQKTYDFLLWLYPLINRIPKGHRLVIGRQMEELGLALLLSIVQANKARGEKRAELQSTISDQLDALRMLIRLSKDLRFMSVKQYTLCAEKINELGRMLSGWIKVSQTQQDNAI